MCVSRPESSLCLLDGCGGESLMVVSQSGLSLSLASLFSGIGWGVEGSGVGGVGAEHGFLEQSLRLHANKISIRLPSNYSIRSESDPMS